ncbi:protein of unknown function [Agreia sp. COWG]|nr:protein of unknown function [Agreia sp. COWG]
MGEQSARTTALTTESRNFYNLSKTGVTNVHRVPS